MIFLEIILGFFLFWCGYGFFIKRPIVNHYFYEEKDWYEISKFPIPEDIEEIIASDGMEVKYLCGITYDKIGRPLFSNFNKKYVKYWRPMPIAPDGKIPENIKVIK